MKKTLADVLRTLPPTADMSYLNQQFLEGKSPRRVLGACVNELTNLKAAVQGLPEIANAEAPTFHTRHATHVVAGYVSDQLARLQDLINAARNELNDDGGCYE